MTAIHNAPKSSFSCLDITAAGESIMSLHRYIKYRFVWWLLHPMESPVVSTCQIICCLWFSIFIAWLVKGALLRYSAAHLYCMLRPLFLGLVLSKFTAAFMWVVVDGYYESRVTWYTISKRFDQKNFSKYYRITLLDPLGSMLPFVIAILAASNSENFLSHSTKKVVNSNSNF